MYRVYIGDEILPSYEKPLSGSLLNNQDSVESKGPCVFFPGLMWRLWAWSGAGSSFVAFETSRLLFFLFYGFSNYDRACWSVERDSDNCQNHWWSRDQKDIESTGASQADFPSNENRVFAVFVWDWLKHLFQSGFKRQKDMPSFVRFRHCKLLWSMEFAF